MLFMLLFTFLFTTTLKMKTNKQGKKSSRTKEQVGSVWIKLCNKTFQTMVSDVLKNVYGTGPHGQLRYFVNDTAIQSLKEASELFLEQMWEQLRHIIKKDHTHTVTSRHVQLWKRITDFKPRFKTNDMSLCKLFKSV